MKPVLSLLISSLLLLTGHALADDQSVELSVAWRVQADGAIFGGVRIDDARVYSGTEAGTLYALNRETGDPDWTYDAGAAISSNVAVDDLRAYFHTRDGRVHAVAKDSGKALWAFNTGGERRWDYWDYYLSTPAVDDRQVYFGSGDHHVYALDKRSGDLRWQARTGNIIHGQPVISGEKVFIGGFDGLMYAFDRGSGRVLWTFKTVGNAYFRNGELPGSATVLDGIVYFGGRDYNLYAVLEDIGTGAWNERTPSWIVGRPLAMGEEVIVVNSDGAGVISYQAKSGQKRWQTTTSYNMFAGARALGAAHIVAAGLDGRITVLDRATGEPRGVFESERTRQTRPEFFNDDGSLDYSGITNLEGVMALYERQMRAMGGIPGEIEISGDRIYYATGSGEIFALQAEDVER